MIRGYKSVISHDLTKKMVLLTGPRQVGKTTFAKSLTPVKGNVSYYNYDVTEDRRILAADQWERKSGLVIFDEIHKMAGWKNYLKGITDNSGKYIPVLVTGSARMDHYIRGGDSLAGRYFRHRMYPLSVAELRDEMEPEEALGGLMKYGGFPEPFFSSHERDAKRWRVNYLDRIIREDIRDLTTVKDVNAILLLVELLRDRVGATVSYSSLAGDLGVSYKTVKSWLDSLESLYIIFKLAPWHRNIARALTKEPKYYFYDIGMVRDEGARYENLLALSLMKHLHYREDAEGESAGLYYLRDREKREVDFVVTRNGKIDELIEAKLSDDHLSRPLNYFAERTEATKVSQIVMNIGKKRDLGNISIEPAVEWLSKLSL